MTRARSRVALLVVVGAAVLATPFGVPVADAAGGLTLTVQPVSRSIRLGDDVALLVTVDNPTQDPLPVPELRLASDAVSVRVRGGGIRPATVTRLHGAFVEGDDEPLRFVRAPTRVRTVAAGGRLQREVRFAAVATGTLELTVTVECGDAATLTADAVEVEVTAPGGAPRLVARVETTAGAVAIDLDGARAFNSVSHFWTLARSGFYAELALHRIVPGVLVQTGDPRGDGTGTAGWYLPSEARAEPLTRGDVALARGAHPDSASCQWVVALAEGERAAQRLAGTYTPLGTVTEGLDVLDAMAADPPPAGPAPRVQRIRTSVR